MMLGTASTLSCSETGDVFTLSITQTTDRSIHNMQRLTRDTIVKYVKSITNYRDEILNEGDDLSYKQDDDSWGVIIDMYGNYSVTYCPYGNEVNYVSLRELSCCLQRLNNKRNR
jgi:hypothetical protein